MKCILALLLSASLFGKPLEAPQEKPTVVILGGGIGALTSALYLSRAGFEPVVIEGKAPGGALTQTHRIENWPGELEIDGPSLTKKIHDQVAANGARFVNEEVIGVDFSHRPFEITLRSLDGEEQLRQIYAEACIVAMGASPNFLGVAGETGDNGYWGRGVTNCATCDGALYKGQVVGVVGGGDAALIEALYLSKIAKDVHIFVRKGSFKASEVKRREALLALPNVTVHYNTTIQEILGSGEHLTHVVVKTGEEPEKKFAIDGLFLAIGSKPNTEIFKNQLKLDENGYIALTKDQLTSVEGVYAIGDIVDRYYKQAISAAGDGCKAALQLQEFVSDLEQEGKLVSISSPKREIAYSPRAKEEGSVIAITSKEQLDKELKESEVAVVVDFYANWCGPCRLLAPLFEHSAEALAGRVKFLKVNVDECVSISRDYGIRAMPTVLVFNNTGKMVDRKVGTDQIAKLLKNLEAEKSKD